VRLLLDEMWPPAIADQLMRRGYDVEAVRARSDLRSKPDEAIFALAQEEQRAIVTEDVSGFRPLVAEALRTRGTHAGLVLTTDRVFPRGHPRTPGRLVSALDTLLVADADLRDREHWLAPAQNGG